MASPIPQTAKSLRTSVAELYHSVRARSLEIVAPLEIEDYVIQTAEFMSRRAGISATRPGFSKRCCKSSNPDTKPTAKIFLLL
jgi:hypothetical protein